MNNQKPKVKIERNGSSNEKLKIIVIGGLEEVGRNMTLLEYGDDIILIDCGLMFPEEHMLGIDYIIPNTDYLKGKEDKVRAVVITHGHYDHIGAIPHIVPKIGNPPVYATKLTAALIRKRQEDYRHLGKITVHEMDPDKPLKLGKNFELEFFRVAHNIPDSVGAAIHTPNGTVIHTGDFKFDLSPVYGPPTDVAKISRLASKGVIALLSDSTDAGHAGHQISETDVTGELEKIFEDAKGRIIVGTFASLINRIQQVIDLAEKFGRKVALEGRSMVNNVEIARNLKYMHVKSETLIDGRDIQNMPDNKVVILATGAQGEENATMMRLATNEHPYLSMKPGDTVIFSSSAIPGNERTIQSLKDSFYRLGAKVYHYQMMDIHAGGHAKREDLKLMVRLASPDYFIPIEGNHFMLRLHAEIAEEGGVDRNNIFVADNGQIIEFDSRGRGEMTKKKVPSDYIMVDGLGVGDVSNIVLRDRQQLAEDGMFVVIVRVDSQTGAVVGDPDIISRGFVYVKGSKKLLDKTKEKVKKILQVKNKNVKGNETYIQTKVRNEIGSFLFGQTKRRPMVLPVLIEV